MNIYGQSAEDEEMEVQREQRGHQTNGIDIQGLYFVYWRPESSLE